MYTTIHCLYILEILVIKCTFLTGPDICGRQ